MTRTTGARQRPHLLVVGVDGSDDADRAIRYAAAELNRRTGRLRLVHVVPETVPMAALMPLYGSDTLEEVGREILAVAERRARGLVADEVRIETVLAHGPRHAALLAHVRDATLVVLGRRPSLIARIRTGSMSAAVAGRASCPVVAVPEQWDGTERHGRVVAAVDESEVSTVVLRAGLAEAADRRAELVVLHAWRPAAPYESVLAGGRSALFWQRQAEPVIRAMLAAVLADHPEVLVTVDLRYERTADALVAVGREADLLLLGRRGDATLVGPGLGSRSRALLRAGVCPVEVVPAPPRPHRHVPRARQPVSQTVLH